MFNKLSLLAAASTLAFSVSSASANEFEPAMQSYFENSIAQWANSPEIVAAVRAANEVTSGYDASTIEAMDQKWRAEVGQTATPTIDGVLSNPASLYLMSQVEASNGVILEVFVMDSVGLNVAASAITSDMWQGDEAKHAKTYGMGPNAVHFGDVELDESTQSYQGQISATVVDPDTGEAIGAVTVGVDADSLL